jgi:predicted ATPase
MAQHPFLKSIRPVNLLSFGPNTEEIELKPLNILIGPNGGGKSNFIEVIRLLCLLPEKEPWSIVLETGGVDEWIWKGNRGQNVRSFVTAKILWDMSHSDTNEPFESEYKIGLDKFQNSFRVSTESVQVPKQSKGQGGPSSNFVRSGAQGELHLRTAAPNESPVRFDLIADQSVLSQLSSRTLVEAGVSLYLPEILEIREFFDSFDFHQDWEFGADLTPRDPVPVGQSVKRLEENGYNLAQMLAYFRDYHRPILERINELMKRFYEPFESLDVRLIGTHLQPAINEKDGISVSAYRLSDGTLRWLALLTILLNPTPGPVTCIDEPELGLHPDAIHILADLLVEASTRTQLIVTTHSDALLDAFTDTPEVVCVCEKVEGSTVIQRLDKGRLKTWLEDYSLGQLWAKGEIGGNRW